MNNHDKQKKKILYLITKSNWGGAQRYVYDLATHIPRDKYSVAVATGSSGALVEKLESANIKTFTLPSLQRDINFKKEVKALFEIFQLLRSAKPDILHVNSSKTGGLGAFLGFILGIEKVIFTVHGWPFKESRPWWQDILIRYFSWLTTLFSTAVIVVSDDDYRKSIWMPFSKKKIVRIHNGIETFSTETKKDAREALLSRIKPKLDNKRNTVWIGTISELTPNKGLKYLIEACKTLVETNPNFLCLIIGGGEMREELERKIKEHNLEKKVFLVGFVPDAPTLLSAFDIVTMTSIKEGLPYMLLEAGIAGNAVVATRTGGNSEIIQNGFSGVLIPPKNSEEVARAITSLMDEPKKRKAHGAALKQTVREHFSIHKTVHMTQSVYENA